MHSPAHGPMVQSTVQSMVHSSAFTPPAPRPLAPIEPSASPASSARDRLWYARTCTHTEGERARLKDENGIATRDKDGTSIKEGHKDKDLNILCDCMCFSGIRLFMITTLIAISKHGGQFKWHSMYGLTYNSEYLIFLGVQSILMLLFIHCSHVTLLSTS